MKNKKNAPVKAPCDVVTEHLIRARMHRNNEFQSQSGRFVTLSIKVAEDAGLSVRQYAMAANFANRFESVAAFKEYCKRLESMYYAKNSYYAKHFGSFTAYKANKR